MDMLSSIFEVGEIPFFISHQESLIIQHPDIYKEFVDLQPKSTWMERIHLYVQLETISHFKNAELIFDCNKNWSIIRNRKDLIIINYEGGQEISKYAVIHDNFKKVDICYSEKFQKKNDDKIVVNHPLSYPFDRTLMMYILAQNNGILLHSAGMEMAGKGYLFAGKSGVGKSTIMKLFSCVAADRNYNLLSDDRIIVRKKDNIFYSYGTPWHGDAEIGMNKGAPLKGIFFISHGSENSIREMTIQESFTKLLPTSIIPWFDREFIPIMLDFCEDLITHVPAYELSFQPDIKIVDFIEKFIS